MFYWLMHEKVPVLVSKTNFQEIFYILYEDTYAACSHDKPKNLLLSYSCALVLKPVVF